MPYVALYVVPCIAPGCHNKLTKGQAKKRKRCAACVKRNWNGQRIQSDKLWALKDYIVGFQPRKNAGVGWKLRCALDGCAEWYWFAFNGVGSGFCRFHAWHDQRIRWMHSWRALRDRHKSPHGWECTVGIEDVQRALESGQCSYCGGPHGARPYALGSRSARKTGAIDRVDPTRGYEPGNIVACCRTCNSKKGAWRSAAQMFAGGQKPLNWPADSFYMSAAHKLMRKNKIDAWKGKRLRVNVSSEPWPA